MHPLDILHSMFVNSNRFLFLRSIPSSTIFRGLYFESSGNFRKEGSEWKRDTIYELIERHGGQKTNRPLDKNCFLIVSQVEYDERFLNTKSKRFYNVPFIKLDFILNSIEHRTLLNYKDYEWDKSNFYAVDTSIDRRPILSSPLPNPESWKASLDEIETLIKSGKYLEAFNKTERINFSMRITNSIISVDIKARFYSLQGLACVKAVEFKRLDRSRLSSSIDVIEQALRINHTLPIAYFAKGMYAFVSNDLNVAQRCFDTFLSLEATLKPTESINGTESKTSTDSGVESKTSTDVVGNESKTGTESKTSTDSGVESKTSTDVVGIESKAVTETRNKENEFVKDARLYLERTNVVALSRKIKSLESEFKLEFDERSMFSANTNEKLSEARKGIVTNYLKNIALRIIRTSGPLEVDPIHLAQQLQEIIVDESHKKMEEDEEVKIQNVENSNAFTGICPITNAKIVNPMRSPCNHIFEREGIMFLLRGGGSIECPVYGCKQRITASSLVYDPILASRLSTIPEDSSGDNDSWGYSSDSDSSSDFGRGTFVDPLTLLRLTTLNQQSSNNQQPSIIVLSDSDD